ncbi:glycoside hydrolase family 9 protein [Paenibacillus sp. FSL R7-0331]|uniref:glycoside hydrolase family 9 protein n=1 Tax=Paenibacillus sp. FSL R7-0331 TaxID=1536773 RepID=UPI0004F812B2|nr:glycoside hydrolase family 9 protein [Paenibacillus sp. FSL R7-0331]AIQ52209.1 glycoside hydrolase [Paenibacillus sp. FSL R7-0331]
MSEHNVRTITVNQIGYPVSSRKTAHFTGQTHQYRVLEATTGTAVFSGETSAAVKDGSSGAVVHSADFSAVTAAGRYLIEAEDGARSAVFAIGERPYNELQKGLLKAFYYYRCGTELGGEYAGPWGHAACHLAEGSVIGQAGVKLDSSGGWHDAGDYGKYSGPGAKAVADLLLAFEWYPAAFLDALTLPESDGSTPDVLLECRVELDWLFKMQEAGSGGVYHKLTTAGFPGLEVMPEDDTTELFFSPVSAAATGDFAGVMAMAARVYEPWDKDYAARCLDAAEAAWRWLDQHPDEPGFTNPPGITTGEYGDDTDRDERFWAAAELYRATGKQAYHEAANELIPLSFPKYSLGWADMGGYGTLAYLLTGKEQTDEVLYRTLQEGLLAEAARLVAVSQQDGYGISLREEDYIWGSNMLVMNNAMLLLAAERFSGDTSYAEHALDHLHYLLGRNVLDVSYVTGYGDHPVRYPHHRPSVGDGVAEPVPGLVSGGPDSGLHDEYVREHLQGKPAAQCFADHEASYSTNEVTIYWNSPAVFVAARFNAGDSRG